MENRIALLGIIVENKEVTDRLNDILHEYADYVVGRDGNSLPGTRHQHHQRGAGRTGKRGQRLVRQAGNAGGGFCQGRVFQGDGNRRSPVNLDVAAFPHAPDEELAPLLEDLLVRPDFQEVYQAADAVRRQTVGDTVHIRALLEFSNYCRRRCRYCGLNAAHKQTRYRMTAEEILASAQEASAAGYRTLVMQSGEDPGFPLKLLGEVIREIKSRTGMAVTVSCGEMAEEDYAYLRRCGADRYLLKHETADPALYDQLHPCGTLGNRVGCLRTLKRLGFETGGGFMVGLPGQTPAVIARDLLLLRSIPCDMAGIGPFIAHPATDLRGCPNGSTELTKRAVSLARLLLPGANLPATTALGVLDSGEKSDVFSCGANVVMKKITPDPYKQLYEIYPSFMRENGCGRGAPAIGTTDPRAGAYSPVTDFQKGSMKYGNLSSRIHDCDGVYLTTRKFRKPWNLPRNMPTMWRWPGKFSTKAPSVRGCPTGKLPCCWNARTRRSSRKPSVWPGRSRRSFTAIVLCCSRRCTCPTTVSTGAVTARIMRKNKHIARKKLTQEEIVREVTALQDMGHKRLALETGEDPSA